MPVTRKRTLEYMEHEWGTYVERFRRLSAAEQEKRLNKMGFETLQDLLAHVLAWWQEGMGIVLAIAEERPFERKKYDFDAFNAEAVARYKSWDKAEFMAHFEKARRKTAADLKSLHETVFENRRVRAWLNAIFILHAREHLLTVSPFLLIDTLENEWAEYVGSFKLLEADKKKEFLAKHGYQSFHDLLAHIIGWWEEGARVTTGILASPGFTWSQHDTDDFNQELIDKYDSWSDEDLLRHYDTVRLALIDLITGLPEDAFRNRDIESWLAEDVIEHYDQHALPR